MEVGFNPNQRAVLEDLTNHIVRNLANGKAQMFLIRQYIGKEVQLLHFDALLHGDIFSQVSMELDEFGNIPELFSPGDIVWVWRERHTKRVMFREATCLDDAAKRELEEVRQKASKDLEEELVNISNGQARVSCISRFVKKDN